MDDAQIEDMWLDFSRRIRAGEVQAAGRQVIIVSHAPDYCKLRGMHLTVNRAQRVGT
jgi:hypothetical protein